jgi:hypothetical protein
MILVDMNQVMIANLMVSLTQSDELQEGLVRHMILNSLRRYRNEFRKEYGELVLCYDSKNYWRRKVFPYYKGTRKKDREKSKHNWNNIFDVLNKLKDEFRDSLPYKVVEVDGAEADDIIAVLVKDQGIKNIRLQNNMQPAQKVLILSGDKDFIQLHRFKFVHQYNPALKKYVGGVDPFIYISEHVLKGDRSDGIPNVLSDDKCLLEGRRQRPLGKKKIESWINQDPDQFCQDDMIRKNYERNKMLIDFTFIPKEVEESIIDTYESFDPPARKYVWKYLVDHELNDLLQNLGDF